MCWVWVRTVGNDTLRWRAMAGPSRSEPRSRRTSSSRLLSGSTSGSSAPVEISGSADALAGCGGLRAAHRLLHGEFAEAFHLNPLLVCLAPLFLVWLAAYGMYEVTGRKSWYPFTRPVWGWGLLATAVAFGITRNILR